MMRAGKGNGSKREEREEKLSYSSSDEEEEEEDVDGVNERGKVQESKAKNNAISAVEVVDGTAATNAPKLEYASDSEAATSGALFEADYRLVKSLSRAVKRARVNGIRNMIRRTADETKKLEVLRKQKESESAVARSERLIANSQSTLESLQAARARFITLRVLCDLKVAVPRKQWQDWNLATQEKQKRDEVENNNVGDAAMKKLLVFINNNKAFREAKERIVKAKSGSNAAEVKDDAPVSKREKRKRTERTVPCSVDGCNAMFGTTESMKHHVKRRHEPYQRSGRGSSAFVDSLAGIEPKRKKNRPGQRQRRKEAILKEIAEGKYEGKEIPSLDRPSKKKAQAWREKQKAKKIMKSRYNETKEAGAPDATAGIIPENAAAHPSWAAKRAQQQKASEGFKGKKITFGDDSDDEE